uniref:LTP-like protein 2 n=1 Tax=Astragalus sinicus TaxID=47065 RepID=Q07A24_ASTSI|nr:LTP-like protein 2 [Astragalus sinicus]
MVMNFKVTSFIITMVMILMASRVLVLEADLIWPHCGRTYKSVARSLNPCLDAAHNMTTNVPTICCSMVDVLLQMQPLCLCETLLSYIAIKPEIILSAAVAIPSRCNLHYPYNIKKCAIVVPSPKRGKIPNPGRFEPRHLTRPETEWRK